MKLAIAKSKSMSLGKNKILIDFKSYHYCIFIVFLIILSNIFENSIGDLFFATIWAMTYFVWIRSIGSTLEGYSLYFKWILLFSTVNYSILLSIYVFSIENSALNFLITIQILYFFLREIYRSASALNKHRSVDIWFGSVLMCIFPFSVGYIRKKIFGNID